MIIRTLANELAVKESQVQAAVALLDEGATVPFIARYRKEVTNGLDDTQLRNLESRLSYLRDLHDRKAVILKSINDQGKLTDALSHAINTAESKTFLEDLYLPYKPRRRTKGQIAIEGGLAPLAHALYQDPVLDPQATATQYINV
ncbi:MAG: RNA-binding transcriptional accessory protein, partial [Glaciecola sp.]|nr:RNA-binding transcriptional accessory protein [Glaciecola sp.]